MWANDFVGKESKLNSLDYLLLFLQYLGMDTRPPCEIGAQPPCPIFASQSDNFIL